MNDQVLTWPGPSVPVISVNSPASTCDRSVTPAETRVTTVSGSQSEPRWTPLLSYKPASGTAGSATMRRPRYAGPDGWPAGSVTLKPAGDEKSRPVASGTSSPLVNVASTCEELSKRLLSARSTWTWKLPGSAPPRFWTVKLTGIVSPAAAMSTPVRKELPVRSGISGVAVVRLTSRVYSPVVPPGTAAVHDRRIVVVVGGAADTDVVDARGRRLEGQVRVAPLLVVERQRRAVRIEDAQEAGQAAAGLLGVNTGVERLAALQRHGVEIDLVGNGQEVRHFGIVRGSRSAGAPPGPRGRAASSVRAFEPLHARRPERPPATRLLRGLEPPSNA